MNVIVTELNRAFLPGLTDWTLFLRNLLIAFEGKGSVSNQISNAASQNQSPNEQVKKTPSRSEQSKIAESRYANQPNKRFSNTYEDPFAFVGRHTREYAWFVRRSSTQNLNVSTLLIFPFGHLVSNERHDYAKLARPHIIQQHGA